MHRAFAGVDPAQLDPFIHMDQMGEVEYAARRAQGHAVAPAPRLRDRDLHDRRRHGPPGHPRRRRLDHRRRHAVDDRRQRACCTSRRRRSGSSSRAACSTACSCGSTCPRPTSGCRRTTRTSAAATSAWPRRPTPARCCASSPARSTASRGRARTHTPMAMVHATVLPGAEMTVPWRTDFNALVYVMSGAGYVGRDRRPSARGPARGAGPRRDHHGRRRPAAGRQGTRRSRSSCSVVCRSASRSPGPGRSS